jgi:hypothetical protein
MHSEACNALGAASASPTAKFLSQDSCVRAESTKNTLEPCPVPERTLWHTLSDMLLIKLLVQKVTHMRLPLQDPDNYAFPVPIYLLGFVAIPYHPCGSL